MAAVALEPTLICPTIKIKPVTAAQTNTNTSAAATACLQNRGNAGASRRIRITYIDQDVNFYTRLAGFSNSLGIYECFDSLGLKTNIKLMKPQPTKERMPQRSRNMQKSNAKKTKKSKRSSRICNLQRALSCNTGGSAAQFADLRNLGAAVLAPLGAFGSSTIKARRIIDLHSTTSYLGISWNPITRKRKNCIQRHNKALNRSSLHNKLP